MDNVLRIRASLGMVNHLGAAIPVAEVGLGGVPGGAVLMLSEQGELEATADEFGNRFAEFGYESTTADLGAAFELTGARDEQITAAVGALIEHVGRRGWSPDQIGVVGYGRAGRGSLLAAGAFPVGAAVSSAARLDDVAPQNAPAVRPTAPWLGMFAQDPSDPGGRRVKAFAVRIDATSPVHTTVLAYPRVTAAFYRDSREPWEHAASFDCWQRTLEWLNLRVAPRPTVLAWAWRERHRAA